jgi:hypothetical protein
MRKLLLLFFLPFLSSSLMAEDRTVSSPDGKLVVTISDNSGSPTYAVTYGGKQMLQPSALGLRTNIGDFTESMTFKGVATSNVDKTYENNRIKMSKIHYVANRMDLNYENKDSLPMTITFCVSNNDVAYRYTLGRSAKDNPKCAVVYSEASAFNFPSQTTTFLCPQITPMMGWERTKPSYEEEYKADAPMTDKSQFGVGYTFPCLFHVGGDGWVLVSETGVTGGYCGSRLSDYQPGTGYTVAYPQKGEDDGFGSEYAGISLPGSTPWRTVTVGASLKPIVETTIPYDVVDPLYKSKGDYKPGRYTWSWLIWQDKSVNYDDQVKFIDLASAMGYEYVLVDNWWDTQIGRDRMVDLVKYAQSKNVNIMLWYNSNGFWNDAPQTPRNCMNTSVARKQEMAWMRSIGVKGIKVDFFAGDKQETMKLYEDILSDANDFGLQVIFHGCTLPRGWERMYPNYVASEAALASENVYFSEHHARMEGFELTMHPFGRNAVASFDWGGVIMNRHLSKDNKSRHQRFTSDVFEMATAITNQTSVNCVAMQPNNLQELPQFELDFLKSIPTTWDEVKFIDGYPTKYVVLARRHGGDWYVAGLNGTSEAKTLTLNLPMFAGQTVKLYSDNKLQKGEILPTSVLGKAKVNKKGQIKLTIQPMGGIILEKSL